MHLYKMQNTDLGFAEKCESEWLTNVYFPSKLGDKPAWLHLGILPTTEALKCNQCNNQKIFLCQIYAPFEDEYNFHRMIYVFICRTESCYVPNKNGNITILRSQLPVSNEFYPDVPPSEENDAVPEILPKNHKLCIACGCPGSFKCSRCKKANYCGTHHQRLHWPDHKVSCSPDENVSSQPLNKTISKILFPEWEIDINALDEREKNDSKHHTDDMQELRKLDEMAASGEAGSFQHMPEKELEKYVQGCEEIDDKYFENFRKESELFPLQIIRYKRSGDVLWISDPKDFINEQLTNIPMCELCGEKRVFEFQIMPQMLNYLKDSNVDWGVIAVFTCPKSCPLPKDKGYVEEWCIKQDITNN